MRERPPTTLLVYLAIWATILVPALVVASENGVVVATVAIASLLLLALWRGSRVAWILLLLLELSVVLSIPFDPRPWWIVLLNVVALALLLARRTRRYVAQ